MGKRDAEKGTGDGETERRRREERTGGKERAVTFQQLHTCAT